MILIERQPYIEHDISFSLTTSGHRLRITKAFQVTFLLLKNVASIDFLESLESLVKTIIANSFSHPGKRQRWKHL